MADLEYKISLNRGDLQRDIAERLEKEGPGMAFGDYYRRAGRAIDQLLTYGNMAVYEGLIAVGVREAKRIQK